MRDNNDIDWAAVKTPAQKRKEAQDAIIMSDIKKIDSISDSNTKEELLALHMELDGKYQSCISDWGKSMYGYYVDTGFDYEYIGKSSLIDNLHLIKHKLEAFLEGWNAIKPDVAKQPTSTDLSVTVNNNISVNITFEQAREKVQEMTALTNKQTQEVIEKINTIEETLKGNDSKKSKWEKIKPVLAWLADKSFDVAMLIIPLILKIQ